MAGTINSLGIGSGVLTAEIIEKLKANDVSLSVTPFDKKLALQKQKSDGLNLLSSLLTTFKSSVSSLANDTLYQQRSVSGNTSGINVIASPGVNIQSFSISDVQLATKNVQQSGTFLSLDQKISSGSGTMNINVGGLSYNIDYTNTMTLSDLKDAINSTAGSMVKASTLQVGQNDYRLILTSVETGENQTISISDSTGGSLSASLLQKDSITSGLFSSSSSLITTGAVAQSDRLDLSQALTDGGLSIEIDALDGNGPQLYSVPFNTSNEQTLSDFAALLNSSGFVSASYDPLVNPTNITMSASTAGVPYSITSPFSTNDTIGATASTSHLTDNVTPSGTYDITIEGTTYNINYGLNTTLQDLADNINATVGSNVASIQLIGSSYQLVLTSTASGDDPTFNVSDSGGFLNSALTTNATNSSPNMQEIQSAKDATFKYDGVTITRSSNEIDDIITGVTIKLLENNASANISISQNVSVIGDEMKTLADSYNTLMSQLKDMTIADLDAGKVGIFNGDSSINSIQREVNKILTSMDNNGMALSQFGIDLNENGIMSFNASTFSSKFTDDSDMAESFFSGKTIVDSNGNTSTIDGVFQTMDGLLKRYTSGNGTLNSLIGNSNEESKTLQANRTRTMSLIEARYEAMTARFIQYDAIMSRLNSQFSALQQQIQMAINTKN